MTAVARVSGMGWQGPLLAVVIHAVGLWLVLGTSSGGSANRKPPAASVKLRLVTRAIPRPLEVAPLSTPRPAPAPKPEPLAPKPRPASPAPRPTPVPVQTPTPAPSPPPTAAATPAEPGPRPRKFTVALEATVPGGGVAVPASGSGGTVASGSPRGEPAGPGAPGASGTGQPGAAAGGAGGPVALGALTRLPRLLSPPSPEEIRALYPEAARQAGLEGDVALRVLVGASGEVLEVRVLRPAGNGFDEAAVRGVKRFRFEPGQQGGRAVATWIPWTYKFRLGE